MKILSLDSSTGVTSVAFLICENGAAETGYRCDTPHARSDSSSLFQSLQAAVTKCGKPDAICVGLGPGSYNGLRAGIATARSFATAGEVPLHAYPSPLAMRAKGAITGPDSGFWATGDARGGHYWVAAIENGEFLERPRLLSPLEAVGHFHSRPRFPILSSSPLDGITDLIIAFPDAGRLAILAEKGDPCGPTETPEPLYLKPPHITMPRASLQ